MYALYDRHAGSAKPQRGRKTKREVRRVHFSAIVFGGLDPIKTTEKKGDLLSI
jgi:hypothetical protein